MIFVTLGSQKFQFDRLLKALDQLKCQEEIFAQIGYSDYEPLNYKFQRFLNRDDFLSMLENSSVVITHGGTGAIISALKKGKKVIAVPRLARFSEHVDNHQIEIVQQFQKLNMLYACEDMDLPKALNYVMNSEFRKYESNTQAIIDDLEVSIEEW